MSRPCPHFRLPHYRPSGVVRTELGRHLPAWLQLILRTVCFVPLHLLMKSPKEGAQTSVFCCVDESLDGKTGLYLVDCKPLQVCAAV